LGDLPQEDFPLQAAMGGYVSDPSSSKCFNGGNCRLRLLGRWVVTMGKAPWSGHYPCVSQALN